MIQRQQETWWFRKIDNMKDDARMLGKTVTRHETAIQDFQAKVPNLRCYGDFTCRQSDDWSPGSGTGV